MLIPETFNFLFLYPSPEFVTFILDIFFFVLTEVKEWIPVPIPVKLTVLIPTEESSRV